ncbi:hypothetical protein ITG13_21460 [Vibrio cyclitrophicus]|nr:hypothetical protein [Vibrio cyclitrophicus]UPR49511.1 hypothetical protein ITG13_21460 [Vibrio cyclitrophicus]
MKQLITLLLLIFTHTISANNSVYAMDDSYSAQYKISEHLGFQVTTSLMAFTVTDNHVIRELPQHNIIEHWVKRDNGRHIFYRHFPNYDSSIHYTRGDLRAFNLSGDWETTTQVIPYRWLQALEKKETFRTEQGSVSRFEGDINGYQVSIDWLNDKGLPKKYTIKKQHQRLTLELLDLTDANRTIAKLNDWDKYRKIDFSDAMDMERDEFVQYLLTSGQLETNGANFHTH